MNDLRENAKGEVLVLTDANVMFDVNTIFELVKHFKEKSIGLVGGNILNYNIKESGISYQEKSYLAIENTIKYQEGVLWGTMMGAFGGIYALRKKLFTKVPEKFIVDDFFQTLQVIEKGYKAINELDAIAHEDVSNNLSDEYNRKIRIGAGNYQNLFRFLNFLNPFKWGRFYSFVSHKLIRWAGPFIIITLLVLSFFLRENPMYKIFFIVQLALIFVPLLDNLLKSIKVNNVLVRFINHFYVMNMALLIGFFKYVKGVKSSTWNPTKRFQ
jgi:cellulose synthase/poly-beta-1,6-N-acetylglucosamine synthase-like glycosyltransferase